MLKERTDTFKWEVGDRQIVPEDAGIVKTCDYCGFRYDEESLVKDENGWRACPAHLFDPEPKPPVIDEQYHTAD